MNLNTLQELLVHELKDLYNAEKQIVRALPKMAKAARSPELKNALEEHLEQTKGQVQRLEQVFEELGQRPSGTKCQAMEGIIAEGEAIIGLKGEDSVKDAALIAAAQRVEHYEIAAYGSARTFAETLGEEEAARLLQTTLDEAGETDHKLTRIAINTINEQAAELDQLPEQEARE